MKLSEQKKSKWDFKRKKRKINEVGFLQN